MKRNRTEPTFECPHCKKKFPQSYWCHTNTIFKTNYSFHNFGAARGNFNRHKKKCKSILVKKGRNMGLSNIDQIEK